jgi:hypothetical protein
MLPLIIAYIIILSPIVIYFTTLILIICMCIIYLLNEKNDQIQERTPIIDNS